MKKEDLNIISLTLDHIASELKKCRNSFLGYTFDFRFIRLTVKSCSAGTFDELLYIAVPECLAIRIQAMLDGALSSVLVSVDTALFHLADSLPSIPLASFYAFRDDLINYCRRHH